MIAGVPGGENPGSMSARASSRGTVVVSCWANATVDAREEIARTTKIFLIDHSI
jgi:hypothetical protein